MRLATVVGAYAIACAVAAVLLLIAFLLHDLALGGLERVGRAFSVAAVGIFLLFGFLTAFVAAAPVAAALIMISEARRIRSALVHCAFGAVTGPSALLIAHLVAAVVGRDTAIDIGMLATVAAVGAIAGGVYWLFAIRPQPPSRPMGPTEIQRHDPSF